MAYADSGLVSAYCANILSGAANFTTSSSPTLTTVNRFLSSGCSIIESYMTAHKYDTPVASTAAAYNWLENLNALYAAAMVEQTRTNVTLSPGERTRGRVMLEQFWSELKEMVKLDLTSMGITRSSDGSLYVGGISIADKETYEDDTDRVVPKFTKGMFDFPGTIKPSGTTAS